MNEQATMQTTPRWDLADKLRKALREVEMSSQEMAEYLEVSRHTVSNWLNGHTRPPASAVKLWAMRCGVPYEWLTSDETLVSSARPDIPAGISAQPGHQVIDNDIAARRKRVFERIPLTPPQERSAPSRTGDGQKVPSRDIGPGSALTSDYTGIPLMHLLTLAVAA